MTKVLLLDTSWADTSYPDSYSPIPPYSKTNAARIAGPVWMTEFSGVPAYNPYPDKSIVILGDDDRHLPERSQPLPNAGRGKALKVAVFPIFLTKEMGSSFTDFNDLHRVRGLDAVKRQIRTALGSNKQKQLRREKTEERAVDKERSEWI